MRNSVPSSVLILFVFTLAFALPAAAQQIALPRIEKMSSAPINYEMRDWKQAARAYDSLVFDLNASGQYLPFVRLNGSSTNYPTHGAFTLPSYVGGTGGEAINCIPAVVGASLVGIDKSSQNGWNWVLMCEDWFNRASGANVYLNGPGGSGWDDWWYDTMPNVFFYQLCSRYPNTGDFQNQFVAVADRWLDAVVAMGGKATPWTLPMMNHRAWNLMTMTPNDNGVKEPEAAGAIAWILYNAFVTTHDPRYRVGAEWAMEFLISQSADPTYELQLPYGAYAAARLNAELGTEYDITKMMNWCFDVTSLRSWGMMTDSWGPFDCAGLIGEVNGNNDYAFLMNTFEHASALVPAVRYDERYARAIGKWMLNAANSARLFYRKYLPQQNQDGYDWSVRYDSLSLIGHEAVHKYKPTNFNITPYATGDAVEGGWAATNFALYGSSHVGVFGAIIDTTNVPMILRLDLLVTDYFHAPAYKTYLYFNPYDAPRSVTVDVDSTCDLYDAVSNSFVARWVLGSASVSIPADGAVVLVLAPAGGSVSYDLDRMLINGVVVDYHAGRSVNNYPPRIKALAADSPLVAVHRSAHLFVTAADRDGDSLTVTWTASGGIFTGTGPAVTWTAPDMPGIYTVTCWVRDSHGAEVQDTVSLDVVPFINHAPVIERLRAHPRKLNLGAVSALACQVTDPDGDSLSYRWDANAGILHGTGASVQWTAPDNAGNYRISCTVSDGHGGTAADSTTMEVRDLSVHQTGSLVAFYPFNGNANDASVMGNNGVVQGATPVPDRFGNPNSAFLFDGISANIRVANSPSLNFQNNITVNLWMKVGAFFDREQYPISHGNWENRWKISISNHRLRWTVKTSPDTVKDLDSETLLAQDSLVMVTAVFDGSDMEVYLNGELDAFTSLSGTILTTNIDLMIGQALPNDNNYNFKGILDDIRIYNYALSPSAISGLYDMSTRVEDRPSVPAAVYLEQNYPNPFNPVTTIRFAVPASRAVVSLRIYDLLGREVAVLADGTVAPGVHTVEWDARSLPSGVYTCVLRFGGTMQTRKLLLMR